MPDYVKNQILKYLPTFVNSSNDILLGLITAIANSQQELEDKIVDLSNISWTEKGLRYSAILYNVLFGPASADSDIQNLMETRFTDNNVRGSEGQILKDIKNLTGDPSVSIDFYGPDECGLIADVTYEGIDEQAIIDVNKAIQANYTVGTAYYDYGIYGTDRYGIVTIKTLEDIRKKIQEDILPIDVVLL